LVEISEQQTTKCRENNVERQCGSETSCAGQGHAPEGDVLVVHHRTACRRQCTARSPPLFESMPLFELFHPSRMRSLLLLAVVGVAAAASPTPVPHPAQPKPSFSWDTIPLAVSLSNPDNAEQCWCGCGWRLHIILAIPLIALCVVI
jgi:hypothetical protein